MDITKANEIMDLVNKATPIVEATLKGIGKFMENSNRTKIVHYSENAMKTSNLKIVGTVIVLGGAIYGTYKLANKALDIYKAKTVVPATV